MLTFLFLRFLHFWRENDVTNCVSKFGFAKLKMGYLVVPFERNCPKDLKTEKSFEIIHPIKRGGRVGLVVIALASHQCGPGSISALGVISGLSLLVLYSVVSCLLYTSDAADE